MNHLTIQICSDDDLDFLAVLNKQLIEDEQHDNKMNTEQLKERMRSFINSDYKAYKFEEHGENIGYALVNHIKQPLYLRQFFICRNCRRKGYGKAAFEKLLEFLNTKNIDIEVMHLNNAGYEFWKSLGFTERSVYMRLEGPNK
ncbi:GNAT family N-acetyltransferase [Paenibacillus periandrae]|uniref:GNAT family N-acetyltransferase n=1 Tax=Paenibacillus periandrae TaxID=1761741 RepID=UPI001F08E82E|nr:GNAT family N-acetyltransferase [Paenibacillus periandrae]